MKEPISRKRFKLIFAPLIVALLIGVGVWCLVNAIFDNKKTEVKQTKKTDKNSQLKKVESNIIHFAAMGDMLAHDTIIANATTETSYNFQHYFQNIRSSYQDADVIFCNQEGPSAGYDYGISGYPTFNAPTEFSSGLQKGAGCNLINLANNHMGDKGTGATDATIDNWNNLKPLAIAGANKSQTEQNTVRYATVKGIKIGLLAFADFNNNKSTPAYSVNIYHDETLLKNLVTEARSNSDLVVVSMHWGTEDSSLVNTDQQTQVNLLSSLGVDVIIGTGPHVLQKFEVVDRADGGKMYVWYSLGNMLSSQLQVTELIGGIAEFDVEKKQNKITISNLGFIPTYMHYE